MIHILFSIITSLAIITLIIYTPISIAIIILIMSICVALITSSIISSWVAFLLFLIYVRGILVIFAYFVATAPNTPINSKTPILLRTIIFFRFYIILSNSNSTPYKSDQNILNTFYSPNTFDSLIILALILLLTIVIVVKLVNLQKGPLRPFKNKYV